MRAWIVLGAVAVLGTTVGGCISILGDFKVDTSDASVNPDVETPDGDTLVDASDDGGTSTGCIKSSECAQPESTPTGCAEAKCIEGECKLFAIDKDKDGHRPPACTAGDKPVETGFDCDDADPTLYPGSVARKCRAPNPDGGVATYQEVGVCKLGTQACTATGDLSSCAGAVGPTAEVCGSPNNNLDENCDGSTFEACACAPATTTPCGITDTGACQKGTRTCTSGGVYGLCVGAIDPKPRRCDSKEDNDCDGTDDNKSVTCLCDPTLGSQPCATGLPGACANGTKTCVISPTDQGSSAYSACQSPAPGVDTCTFRSDDNNCTGIAGDESSCLKSIEVYYNGAEKCATSDTDPTHFITGTNVRPTVGYSLISRIYLYAQPDLTDAAYSVPIYRCNPLLGANYYAESCGKGFTPTLMGYANVPKAKGAGWSTLGTIKAKGGTGYFTLLDLEGKPCSCLGSACVAFEGATPTLHMPN